MEAVHTLTRVFGQEVRVESGVAMAYDDGVAAWTFDPPHWGRCGQGRTEAEALADLAEQTEVTEFDVVERIAGDEQAFAADLWPATDDQREETLRILTRQRAALLDFLHDHASVLDLEDAERALPGFASWRTLRQMAWHVADTESRYYLPSLGLPARDSEPDLHDELRASAVHVADAVRTMPADLIRRDGTEVWTTVKVLRRLAWHERAELVAMRDLAARLATG